MSTINDIRKAPALCFVLIGVLFAAFVLLVTGLASPEWVVMSPEQSSAPTVTFGLWKVCISGITCSSGFINFAAGGFAKYRVFLAMAALLAGGTEVTLLVFTAVPSFRTRPVCALLTLGCFSTVISDLMGIILFVVDFNLPSFSKFGVQGTVSFGWGLVLAAVGGALCLLAAGLVSIMALRIHSSPMTLAGRPMSSVGQFNVKNGMEILKYLKLKQ